MLTSADWQALGLSLRLATVTTLLLLLICLPLAWWLGRGRSLLRQGVSTLSLLPLALPPTVLGFYLLFLLGAGGPLAKVFDGGLAFSFTGIVIGSMLYSLPFVLQPLASAFRGLDAEILDLAASLGAGPYDRFFTVGLPLAWPGILTAGMLGFAHTLGEFGVIMMIGGSIPGETLVASVALFEYVESGQPARAHAVAAVLLGLCLLLVALVAGLDYGRARWSRR